jgi:hypothetical protein
LSWRVLLGEYIGESCLPFCGNLCKTLGILNN